MKDTLTAAWRDPQNTQQAVLRKRLPGRMLRKQKQQIKGSEERLLKSRGALQKSLVF